MAVPGGGGGGGEVGGREVGGREVGGEIVGGGAPQDLSDIWKIGVMAQRLATFNRPYLWFLWLSLEEEGEEEEET